MEGQHQGDDYYGGALKELPPNNTQEEEERVERHRMARIRVIAEQERRATKEALANRSPMEAAARKALFEIAFLDNLLVSPQTQSEGPSMSHDLPSSTFKEFPAVEPIGSLEFQRTPIHSVPKEVAP